MIYVFIPYYNDDTKEFKQSLESQTYKVFRVIRRNRKQDKILWTKAVNDFWKESFRWCGASDDDIVLIMNNDVVFGDNLFEELTNIKQGHVWYAEGVLIKWKQKRYRIIRSKGDSFIGHSFAMTLKDFRESGGFCRLLPHALADIDYGIKVAKKLNYFADINASWEHPLHIYEGCNMFSLRSYSNPLLWSIFLLRHPNKYTPINILKVWYDGLFR